MSFSIATVHPALELFCVSEIQTISLLPSASANLAFRVKTRGGECLLRCCRRHTYYPRLKFLAKFQQTLSTLGFPVPRLYLNRNGGEFIFHNGHYWQLMDFVGGKGYQYDQPSHICLAASKLAEWHHRLKDQHFDGYQPYDQPLVEWWTASDEILSETHSIVTNHLPSLQVSEAWSLFMMSICQVQYLVSWTDYRALPQTWTHGDFHGLNLKFDRERLVAIFDFDQVDYRPRIYDIAYALLMLTRYKRGCYQLDINAINIFIEQYETRANPLSLLEYRSIPAMMILSQLPDPGYLITLKKYQGNLAKAVAYWVMVLTQLHQQYDQLLDWFSSKPMLSGNQQGKLAP